MPTAALADAMAADPEEPAPVEQPLGAAAEPEEPEVAEAVEAEPADDSDDAYVYVTDDEGDAPAEAVETVAAEDEAVVAEGAEAAVAEGLAAEDAAPEADVAEADAADPMPAIYETVTAENGVTATVSAPEGAFPEGTAVSVRAASAERAAAAAEGLVEGEVAGALAVEITFTKDGAELEPAGGTRVAVTLRAESAVAGETHEVVHIADSGGAELVAGADVSADSATFQADEFSVYAIVGVGEEPAGGLVEDIPTLHVTFLGEGGAKVAEQIVKDGEELLEPEAPESDSGLFTGWYEEGSDARYEFGPKEVAEDSELALTARYAAPVHVVYYDLSGEVVLRTDAVGKGSKVTLDPQAPPVNVQSLIKGQVGWEDMSTGTQYTKQNGNLTFEIEGDLNLKPVLADGYWVTFDSAGGALVPKQFVLNGAAEDPGAPKRSGYEFDGWYLQESPAEVDADGNVTKEAVLSAEKYDFATTVTGPITLVAKWKASHSSYRVVIWTQDGASGEYEFGASYTVDAESESEVRYEASRAKSSMNGEGLTDDEKRPEVLEALTVAGTGGHVNDRYLTYVFDHSDVAEINTAGGVAGDGSTVVNVYYRMFTYELVLNFNGKITDGVDANGNKYKSNAIVSLGQVRFGTNNRDAVGAISQQALTQRYERWYLDGSTGGSGENSASWGEVNISGYHQARGKIGYDGMRVTWKFVANPAKGQTFARAFYRETIESAENPDTHLAEREFAWYWGFTYSLNQKTDGAAVANPTGFTVRHSLTTTPYGDTVNTFKKMEPNNGIASFDAKSGLYSYYSQTARAGNVIMFKYTRNTYGLTFVLNGGTEAVEFGEVSCPADRIPYEKPLTTYVPVNYVTEAEAAESNGAKEPTTYLDDNNVPHVFTGWYDNAACAGSPVDFSTLTMPARNLALYAGWKSQEFEVDYRSNYGTLSKKSDQVEFDHGITAPEPTNVPEGYVFIGWTDQDNKLFDPASETVTRPLVLTAQFARANGEGLHVDYAAGEGSGTVSDTNEYAPSATAVVQDGSDLTAPAGKHFVGWKSSADGQVYLPGELVTVTDGLTLTALYSASPAEAVLTYDYNYEGNGVATAPDVEPTDTVTMLNNSKVTVDAPDAGHTPEGYDFGGWYLTPSLEGTNLTGRRVLVDALGVATNAARLLAQAEPSSQENRLYAKWAPHTHEVSYALEGELPEGVAEDDAPAAASHSFAEAVAVAEEPAAPAGWRFTGWRTSDAEVSDGSFTMPDADVAFVGSFELVDYTVTYADGVGGAAFADVVTSGLHYGDATPAFAGTPTRAGYDFAGWDVEPAEAVTADATYVAQWTPRADAVLPGEVDPEPTPTPTPTPTPAPAPAPAPAAPAAPAAAPAAPAAAAPAAPAAAAPAAGDAIADDATPLAAPATIEDDGNPLANIGSWALVNLVCAVLTVVTALGMLLTFLRRRDDDEDESDETRAHAAASEDEEDEDEAKRRKSKLLGLIPAIASVIIFILTEDMSLPMAWVDRWTLLMACILVVNLLAAYLTRNRRDDDEDDERGPEPAAAIA